MQTARKRHICHRVGLWSFGSRKGRGFQPWKDSKKQAEFRSDIRSPSEHVSNLHELLQFVDFWVLLLTRILMPLQKMMLAAVVLLDSHTCGCRPMVTWQVKYEDICNSNVRVNMLYHFWVGIVALKTVLTLTNFRAERTLTKGDTTCNRTLELQVSS